MYGNYCYPNYFMPLNFPSLLLNNYFMCPSEISVPSQLKVHYKIQPQSYTTKQNLVKSEENIQKKEGQVKTETIQIKKLSLREGRRNKSIFHNYQKHLVTTLKQKITIKELKQIYPDDQCITELWYNFTSSKIANRALLLAVFGEQQDKDQQVKKYIEKCQFSDIFTKFSMQTIKISQRKLRKVVKIMFKQKNLDQQLENRKLQTQEKSIFKQYIIYFINQLASGVISKRFPKKFKKQIIG